MIFISHRSTDKPFADLIVSFLRACEIKTDQIFCSSLPGNDVKSNISGEIKENLQKSVLNIALLSKGYYESSYCMNEAGIIWYLDTPKQIICMPEINNRLMEGFLNSDNRIHRLDKKSDILAMVDYIRPLFDDFIASRAALDGNVDKLIREYQKEIECRITLVPAAIPTGSNSLENRILTDNFILEELVALKYLYDERTDIFDQHDSSFVAWLSKNKIDIMSSINIAEYLLQSKIAGVYTSDFAGLHSVHLTITSYRELMKLSSKALAILNAALERMKNEDTDAKASASPSVESDNLLDDYIAHGFVDYEILLLKYAYDTSRVKFMCGWQTDRELSKITAWEDVNCIKGLSNKYEDALERLYMRKILVVSAETSSGNIKEYRLSDEGLSWLDNLAPESIKKMGSIVEKFKVIPTSDWEAELPDLPF